MDRLVRAGFVTRGQDPANRGGAAASST
ncbi:hypothetical protein [Nocardia sp. CA-135398]